MSSLRSLPLLFILALLTGCMTQPVTPTQPTADPLPTQHTPPAITAQQIPPAPAQPLDIWQRLQNGFELRQHDNPRIEHQLKQLSRNETSLITLLSQAEPYLFHILEEVENRGIPTEIALLPAVESGFRPYAYSRLGAAGLWQFMPATGRRYGLEQDWWQDERRDPLAATDSALTMLQGLQQMFDGDWLLALAAYNAGPGNVLRAIKKNQKKNLPTDYWALDLPKETENYVPRLLAMARLVDSANEQALSLPEIPNKPYFTVVETGSQLDLNVAAELAGLPVEDLLELNAGYNRWATAPQGPHRLLLPTNHEAPFKEKLAELPDEQRLRWKSHKVSKGETLGGIARRYGIGVKALQQANQLSGNLIRINQRLMIPLSESPTSIAALNRNGLPKSRVHYRVRKGDSLYLIAQRFNVKVADLRRWNNLSRHLIKPGQRLMVMVDPSSQTI